MPIGKIKAKKSFGQHFLNDEYICQKIIEEADIRPGDNVIEVGPGMGALTDILFELDINLWAIELERSVLNKLKPRFNKKENCHLIEGDALKFNFGDIPNESGGTFKLVSNLPYNISGPFIAKIIDDRKYFTSLTLMLQKEVASRLTAEPGTKAYGALTVLTKTFFDTFMLFDVAPECFTPSPKVESSVIKLYKLDKPRVNVVDDESYKSLVKNAFTGRRKTLLNSLSASLKIDKELLSAILKDSSIDSGRRAETLTLDEFAVLHQNFIKHKKNS